LVVAQGGEVVGEAVLAGGVLVRLGEVAQQLRPDGVGFALGVGLGVGECGEVLAVGPGGVTDGVHRKLLVPLLTHIARHNITPYEVEQALYTRPRLAVPGRESTTEVLGITTAADTCSSSPPKPPTAATTSSPPAT